MASLLPESDGIDGLPTATVASVGSPIRDGHTTDLPSVNESTIADRSHASDTLIVDVQNAALPGEDGGLAAASSGLAPAGMDASIEDCPSGLVASEEYDLSRPASVDGAVGRSAGAGCAYTLNPGDPTPGHVSGGETSSRRAVDAPRVSSVGVQVQLHVTKRGTSRPCAAPPHMIH